MMASSATWSPESTVATASNLAKGKLPAKSSYKRPNYNVIHADPLPISLYHAPPLIPHNPLSVLHHFYLYLFPPIPPRPSKYPGLFSTVSMCIEVTDPTAVSDLWQKGFWGKGNLSRSEPTWLQRELRRLGDTTVTETSEEITRRRRDERKEMKKERARKELEEMERVKLQEAAKSTLTSKGEHDINERVLLANDGVVVNLEDEITGLQGKDSDEIHPPNSGYNLGLLTPPPSISENGMLDEAAAAENVGYKEKLSSFTPIATPPPPTASSTTTRVVRFDSATAEDLSTQQQSPVKVQDREHLQLFAVEAFFLAYALDVLAVRLVPSAPPLTILNLLQLLLRHSTMPPLLDSSVSLTELNPDNKFLIHYTAYHHFRSLGWVVKSGVKFSVDYLLYKRGPVFSHAEFALVILPSYSRWKHGKTTTKKEWNWLHSVTRVNSQVKKTVVLVYVDVPTREEIAGWVGKKDALKELFSQYRIKEVALRRWIPGRNRD